ncbi:HAD-IA family hydrolase [Kitasatospora sp. NPDC004614]
MRIRAVLFDVDGVLLDSAAAHRQVWGTWSRLHGLDEDQVWELTFGRRPQDTVRDAAPHLDPLQEQAVLDSLLHELGLSCPPIVGADGLLRRIPADGWALVTSGDRSSVHRRFASAGLPLPTVQVYADDVAAGKPAADCYLLASRLISADPRECMVVEDSPAGVAAGSAAGCTVIGVTTTHKAAQLAHADVCVANLHVAAEELARLGFVLLGSDGRN